MNALRARDRDSYRLFMERHSRAGHLLFTLQVTIGVQVLGVRALPLPLPLRSLTVHMLLYSYSILSSCAQSRPPRCSWRTART